MYLASCRESSVSINTQKLVISMCFGVSLNDRSDRFSVSFSRMAITYGVICERLVHVYTRVIVRPVARVHFDFYRRIRIYFFFFLAKYNFLLESTIKSGSFV